MSLTNIILSNLSCDKLTKVLEFCKENNIHYTFDNGYYSSEYYDIFALITDIILTMDEVPIVYKEIIENEYKDYIDDGDNKLKKKILKKMKNIKYENSQKLNI